MQWPLPNTSARNLPRARCTLNSADRDLRKSNIRTLLAQGEVEELPNGVSARFSFEPEMLRDLVRVIQDETACCGFLDFRLTVKPSQNILSLEITGPEGTNEFFRQIESPASSDIAK
jgi:hypothetical protein